MDLGNLNAMNAPWGLTSRKKLVFAALDFFDAEKYTDNCKIIGKDLNIYPKLFSLSEFVTYLEKKNIFLNKKPNIFRIISILDGAVSGRILLNLRNKPDEAPGTHDRYLLTQPYFESAVRGQGLLRLIPALGSDFLYQTISPGIVHIKGKNDVGDEKGGTGIILDRHHILTCAHVTRELSLDKKQNFQNIQCTIKQEPILEDEKEDVAIIQADKSLEPVTGMVFQAPVIGKNVFALGFSGIPNTKHEPILTMHGGAVTNESVTLYGPKEENLFLCSAISRPGNSGGPIISEDGYIIGIVSKDLTQKNIDQKGFSPHYAGVAAHVIIKVIESKGLNITIPFENFE